MYRAARPPQGPIGYQPAPALAIFLGSSSPLMRGDAVMLPFKTYMPFMHAGAPHFFWPRLLLAAPLRF